LIRRGVIDYLHVKSATPGSQEKREAKITLPFRAIKIILVGEPGVGKKTLFEHFSDNVFESDSIATIGVDFGTMIVSLGDSNVKFQMWGVANEERFRFLIPTYLRGALGAIIMYDITDRTSFEAIDGWFTLLREEARKYKKFPIMIVGNKIDLDFEREVSTEEGRIIANSLEAIGHIECSMKSKEDIERIFQILALSIIEAPIEKRERI
jgi:small GTP-binding protein